MIKKILIFIHLFSVSLLAESVICIRPSQAVNTSGQVMKKIALHNILTVKKHPNHKGFYLVGSSGLLVPTQDFHNLEQSTAYYEKMKLTLENNFTQLQTRLQQILSDLNTIERQTLETERDTSLSYRSNSGFRSGLASYSYSGFISSSKARKLIEKLKLDYKTLSEEKLKTQKQVESTLSKRVTLDHQVENTQKSLSGLSANENIFFINKDQSPIHSNGRISQHLAIFTKVKARTHPKHSGWHQIIHHKKVYDTPSENLTKVDSLSKRYAILSSKNLTKIKQMGNEIQNQSFSILLLQAISRQLETDRFLSGGYGVLKNITVKIDANTSFTIDRGNHDSVYVNQHRAEKVLMTWHARLQNKKQYLILLQNELLKLKQAERVIESEKNKALDMIQN